MSQKKTEGLLDELERLRSLLKEEKDRSDHLNQHIPVLTDLADQEDSRQTVAVLNVKGDYQQSHPQPPTLSPVIHSGVSESELKSRLRKQARLFIQEIIDEELVRVEAQLNRELNHYLDHLLDQMPENLSD
ncbi:hypothetical protein [Endozoicomonas numazuensis]|uniref:Uncharacterized protein n=1 Tax=Endozoicomonas numazuensis TaxID=1137799 RepID=A0A081N104_9GAMM|nr:hypothetical protein [Endozoicomonas numazuensis]KEQ12127.1 hypothetical protein GZ78_28245 [Endozoicomonas numazuensis]